MFFTAYLCYFYYDWNIYRYKEKYSFLFLYKKNNFHCNHGMVFLFDAEKKTIFYELRVELVRFQLYQL